MDTQNYNPLKKTPVKREKCGTYLGARQHMYKHENMCDPCSTAFRQHQSAYAKDLRKKNPEYAEKHRALCRIQRATFRELALRHPEEYDEIYAELKNMEEIYGG